MDFLLTMKIRWFLKEEQFESSSWQLMQSAPRSPSYFNNRLKLKYLIFFVNQYQHFNGFMLLLNLTTRAPSFMNLAAWFCITWVGLLFTRHGVASKITDTPCMIFICFIYSFIHFQFFTYKYSYHAKLDAEANKNCTYGWNTKAVNSTWLAIW